MLLIACPCYANQMFYQCANSLIQLKSIMDFDIEFVGFDSLIPRARNFLTHKFLSNPKYDKLLFLDVDIQFNPNDVLKLYEDERNIVCGAYPKKKLDKGLITKNVVSSKDPLINASKLAINRHNTENTLKEAPTGFLMIHRSVFDNLKEHVDYYFSDISAYKTCSKIYNFFNPFVHNNRYLSEDYAFSHLCTEHGYTIYIDNDIKLKHIGTYIYT